VGAAKPNAAPQTKDKAKTESINAQRPFAFFIMPYDTTKKGHLCCQSFLKMKIGSAQTNLFPAEALFKAAHPRHGFGVQAT
jgi:hypothetical protein